MIPSVSREKLLEAMEEFDKELRSTDEWSSWKQKGTYKYAIVHDGHHYPVKQIISMATGEPKSSFSGGYEANNYVSKRGLSTVSLEDDNTTGLSIRDGLEEILAHYAAARASEPFKGHDLRHTFNGVSHAIAATNTVGGRPTLTVKASMGQGNWATIPWIALLDSRETNTIHRGVYCVYLFQEDMSGVYLTLAQGVTVPKAQFGGDAGARRHLRARAKDLRPRFEHLGQHGFTLDDDIDLHTQATLGKNYEASTILYKFYGIGSIPDDSVLIDDLETLLSAFEGYLQSQSDAKVAPSIEQLSAMTNFSPSQLTEIESLCSTKKQIIFEGPPGVGKTYVAELFARYFTGNQLEGAHDERIVVVQFHQSYGTRTSCKASVRIRMLGVSSSIVSKTAFSNIYAR
jgi:5-methylcytosine-specific restriction enzyme B